jgi:hypothetical protein
MMEEQIRRIIIDLQQVSVTIEQVCGDTYVYNYNKFDIDELQLTENFISLLVKKNNLNLTKHEK